MSDGASLGAAVIDASVLVDLLAGTELAGAARDRLSALAMHAPAHVDVEVLSALGRMHRAGQLEAKQVRESLSSLSAAPISRHPLPELVVGAWERRDQLRLTDALYVELAVNLDLTLLTTDRRLWRAYPAATMVER